MADPKKPAGKKDDKPKSDLISTIGGGGAIVGGAITNAMVQDALNRKLGRSILDQKFNESLQSQVKAKPTSITSSRVSPPVPVKPPTSPTLQRVGPTPASGVNPRGNQQPTSSGTKTSPVPSSGQRFDPSAGRASYPKSIISNASFDNTAIDAARTRSIGTTGRDLSPGRDPNTGKSIPGARVPMSSPERASAKQTAMAQDRAQLPGLEQKARGRVAARQRAVIRGVQRSIQPINNTLQSLGASGVRLNIPTSQIKEQTDEVMEQASQRSKASDKPLSTRQTERAASNLSKEAGLVPRSKFGQVVSNVKDVGRAIGGIKINESKINLGKGLKYAGGAMIPIGVAMPYINQAIGKARVAYANRGKEAPASDAKPAASPNETKPLNPVEQSAFNSALNGVLKRANNALPSSTSQADRHAWIIEKMTNDYGESHAKMADKYLKSKGL